MALTDPGGVTPTSSPGGNKLYTTYFDEGLNAWVQVNNVTGQQTILKQGPSTSSGGGGSAPAPKASQLVEIPGQGWVWVDPYGQSITPAGISSQEPFGGYTATQTPTGTLIWDPKTGATGAFYPDEPDPVATPTPKYIGQSNGQLIIQNPDGSFSFQAIPNAPGTSALKPASATYSYNGPTARPRASTASGSTYDAMKAQQAALAAQAAEAEKQRAFTGGQNTIDRNLQVYRDAAGQRFTGGENAIDRNLSNAQFGANFGLNREGLDLQRRQVGLQGAQAYASLVSTPDLAALPAFLEAGGGNVINGIAGGNDMITPNSVLPGALALQQLRKPFNELPEYNYTPETNPNIPAAMPMPALAGGGMVRDPMFMVGDRPDGMPTGTEEVVLNPTGAPLAVVPNSGLRGPMPRFAEGTDPDLVYWNSADNPGVGPQAVGTYSTAVGGVAGGGGAPPSSPQPPPVVGSAPKATLPRGYVAVDPKDIPQDRLGPAGTVWTYAHNPTTGKVVRIDAKTGQQFGMYSTLTPPTAQKTTGGYNTPGPRSVTGAVRNAISRANTVGGNAVGVNQAMLNRGVFGPNPYGFQYNPSALSGGSRPSAFRPPATTPQTQPAPTTGTPPGTVDTPAGSVNTNTGSVTQNPPATPAETAQADNSIEQNMRTVEDFRRSFQPAVPWNPMQADYWERSPDLREISEFGQQTKFGTPVRTLQNEAQRFRLPGVSRSNLALGV